MQTPEDPEHGSGAEPALDEPFMIDRTREASEIVEFIRSSGRGLCVLHGRRGSGKTEMIRRWIMPGLSHDRDTFYGECLPLIPELVTDRNDGNAKLSDALERGGIVFLDNFESFLGLPAEDTEQQVDQVLAGALSDSKQGLLVLILDEGSLGRLFALKSKVPGIMDAAFEIRGIELSTGLESLAESDESRRFSYDPAVFDALNEALKPYRARGWDFGPELLSVLHLAFSDFLGGSENRVIDVAAFQKLGGLREILRHYLEQRVEQSDPANGGILATVLLRRVVQSNAAKTSPDFSNIPARFEVEQEILDGVLRELLVGAGPLRALPRGHYHIVPPHLIELIEEGITERDAKNQRLHRIIEEGTRVWNELDNVLPRNRFLDVHSHRHELNLTGEASQFLLQCALVHEDDQTPNAARYWLSRGDRDEGMQSLLAALFNSSEVVRAKAARLLADFPEPEVRNSLYLTALQDPDAGVREAAITSLAPMGTDALNQLVIQEVEDPESPRRAAAIEILRIFRNERTAATLKELVDDRSTSLQLRESAIRILGHLNTSAAVDALLDIGLFDEDEEDRKGAAQSLGALQTDELHEHLFAGLRSARRHSRKKTHPTAGVAVRFLAKAVLGAAILVGNIWVHGLALFAIKRFWWGAAFLVTEAVGIYLSKTLGGDTGFFVLFGSGLLSYLVAAKLLYRAHAKLEHERNSFRAILTGEIFFVVAYASIALRGLSHVLTRRVRLGLVLGGLWALGLFLWGLAGDSPVVTGLPRPFPWAYTLYFNALGLILMVGTWFFDVIGSMRRIFRTPGIFMERSRRGRIYRQVLTNERAARLVFAKLESSSPKEAKWARSVLRRFWGRLPTDLLIEMLQRDDTSSRRYVMKGLGRTKSDATVAKLRRLWSSADRRLRGRIVGVLCRSPNQASIKTLKELEDVPWLDRVLCSFAEWHFIVAVWPAWMKVGIPLALPILVLFISDGVMAAQTEAWPQIKAIRSRLPLWDKDKAIERRTNLVKFLAEQYPQDAADPLLDVYTNGPLGTGEARIEYRAVILSGLGGVVPRLDQDEGEVDEILASLTGALSKDPPEPGEILLGAMDGLRKALFDEDARPPEGDSFQPSADLKASRSSGLRELFGRDVLAGLRSVLEQEIGPAVPEAAIELLALFGNTNAVTELESFAIRTGLAVQGVPVAPAGSPREPGRQTRTPAVQESSIDQRRMREMSEAAIVALGDIDTPESTAALENIANKVGDRLLIRMVENQLSRLRREESLVTLRALLDQGEYWQIVNEVEALLSERDDPGQQKELYALLGLAHFGLNDFDQTIGSLDQAGDLDEDGVYALVVSLTERARRTLSFDGAQALADIDAALAVNPDYAPAFALRGQAYLTTGEYALAGDAFEEATRLDPEDSWSACAQHWIEFLNEENDKALNGAKSLIESHSNPDQLCYSVVLEVYSAGEHYQEAADYFESLGPDDWIALDLLTYVYHDQLNAYEKAYKAASRLQTLVHAGMVAPWQSWEAGLVETYVTTGDFDRAIREGLHLLQSEPDHEYAYVLNVNVYISLLLRDGKNDAKGAYERLDALERLCDNPPDWSFTGLERFVEQRHLSKKRKDAVLELIRATSSPDLSPDALRDLVEKNRRSLGSRSWFAKRS